MPGEDKQDLQDILGELKKVLTDLTKEEKQQVVNKIEKKLGEVGSDIFSSQAKEAVDKFYPKAAQQQYVPAKPAAEPQLKPSVPQQPPAVKVQPEMPRFQPPAAQVPVKPQVPQYPVTPVPPQQAVPPKPVQQPAPSPFQQSIKQHPAVPLAGPPSPFKPLFIEQTPSVNVTQVPEVPVVAKPAAPVTVPVVPAVPQVQPPVETKTKEEALSFACFYPAGQNDLKDTFAKNLVDVFKKTSKKPGVPECALECGIDILTIDWKQMIDLCREKQVKDIFVIHPDGYDPSEIKNRIQGTGIFFYAIPVTQINRKLTYVDLVIELMLHKG